MLNRATTAKHFLVVRHSYDVSGHFTNIIHILITRIGQIPENLVFQINWDYSIDTVEFLHNLGYHLKLLFFAIHLRSPHLYYMLHLLNWNNHKVEKFYKDKTWQMFHLFIKITEWEPNSLYNSYIIFRFLMLSVSS